MLFGQFRRFLLQFKIRLLGLFGDVALVIPGREGRFYRHRMLLRLCLGDELTEKLQLTNVSFFKTSLKRPNIFLSCPKVPQSQISYWRQRIWTLSFHKMQCIIVIQSQSHLTHLALLLISMTTVLVLTRTPGPGGLGASVS